MTIALTLYALGWGIGAIAFWNKPPPRLNGWQRIGIVVSIVWAISAFIYASSQKNWAVSLYEICITAETPLHRRECVASSPQIHTVLHLEFHRVTVPTCHIRLAFL